MDCHQGEKRNFSVMTKIVLLPCSVTIDGAKAMGCCPKKTENVQAMLQIVLLPWSAALG